MDDPQGELEKGEVIKEVQEAAETSSSPTTSTEHKATRTTKDVQKIKDLRGESSTEYKIASDAMGAVWRGLLQTTKGIDMAAEIPTGTKISLDEWNEIWMKYNPNHLNTWQREYVKYMFFLFDASGDKYIDKKEYCDVMKLYDMSKTDAAKAFDSFAVDEENGKKVAKINYGMFLKLWNDYFTSTDKKCAANFLFGPW